ncbi:hypothetical protein BDV93DRAFT_520385 [Ceratobasidium sp. AG-I]|nr:hypothetical protein BDV93DRAFT_520385 [Ceratobasidium sp. AG-I]
MSSFRNTITHVLKLQPLKPCNVLSDDELLEEEVKTRGELGRLVASLSLHIGTCAAHGALSAGASLPLHLPVVVWIAYSLTKCAKRYRLLRTELRQNRRHLKPKNMRNKRIAASIILGLLAPLLAALGADIISEIITALAGGPDTILTVGSSGASGDCDFKIVASDNGIFNIDASPKFNVSQEASQLVLDELLERWQDSLIRGVPADFEALMQVIDPQRRSNRAGVVLPRHYQIYCNACQKQISDGFACSECHDFDLCHECYTSVKHEDAKRHAYDEFKIEEEISEIQHLMSTIRRDNIVIASRRGDYRRCNKCTSLLSAPSSGNVKDVTMYYNCNDCEDFDVCSKCFPQESKNEAHSGHTFNMVAATDDEATISRLSSPRTPRVSGSHILQQSPSYSPELPAYSRSPPSSSFQPLFRNDSVPIMSAPSRPPAVARPKSDRPRYHCDACHFLIETDEHYRCIDPECTASSSIDLHLECGDWVGGGHRITHEILRVSSLA